MGTTERRFVERFKVIRRSLRRWFRGMSSPDERGYLRLQATNEGQRLFLRIPER